MSVVGSPYVDLDRPPLRAAALRRALVRPEGFVRDLRVATQTGSTNADLAELARGGAPEGTVLAVEHQGAGRGRLDRTWTAPPRSSLTFSTLVRPDAVPASRWPWLPLLAGCAVVEVVRGVAGVDAGLKWPNDVLIDDRKVAGILLEQVRTPTGPAAVLGIGLNVSTRTDELASQAATSLILAGAAVTDRATLLGELLRSLGALYTAWSEAGGDPAVGLAESYRNRCVTLGRRVRLETGPGTYVTGTARDLDEGGRLVVDTRDGTRVFGAGDVIHLR